MDQGKLFKALERQKVQRDAKQRESATQLKPASSALVEEQSSIFADLIPADTLTDRSASLKDMRNPVPMAVSEMKRNKLIYPGMKNNAVLTAFRELRIQLMDANDSGNMAVLISSVDQNDHSIVTAMNLAISFSLDFHSSALLVDCNPYGTDLQNLVTSKLTDGITDYVLDKSIGLDATIYPSGIERVNVIPSGNNPISAVEQFSSQAMQTLLYELKNRYSDRFLVINTPPVLSSSEARVLSKFCDHSVLTVPYGRANIDAIEDCVDALGAANVSGVVYQQ